MTMHKGKGHLQNNLKHKEITKSPDDNFVD